MLAPGTLILGKYEIVRMIGKGGMSTVYLARDHVSDNVYAIKDVERSGTEDGNKVVVQSLATEGYMLKRLSNPHLPKIYDVIEDEHSFMLVMDYVEGESLDKVIAKNGPQSVENIYNWCSQICDVFAYLHGQPQPVVYRDMKPANVILQPNGNIMMIDFGTARTQKVGQYMQSDTICIGTEGFAAPEQYGGISQSDARTDIFCLGGTIYNLLTGHSPCDKPRGILPLDQFDPSLVGTPLDAIITKCTRKDPNERYQTALELKEDLQLAAAGKFQTKKRGQSGNLRGNSWQILEPKRAGATSGLSGLLSFGKNKNSGQLNPQQPATPPQQPTPEPPPQESAWKTPSQEPVYTSQMQYEPQTEYMEEPEEQGSSIWRKTMIWSAVAAAVAVLLSVVFSVLAYSAVSTAFLCVTAGAVVLAGIAAFMEFRQQRSGE